MKLTRIVLFQTDFIASILNFANTFNALSLNDTEVGLFSAVVLLTADRSGITDVKSIEHHQDKLIEALKVQVGGISEFRNYIMFSPIIFRLVEITPTSPNYFQACL